MLFSLRVTILSSNLLCYNDITTTTTSWAARPLLGARSKLEMSGTRMFPITNVAHDNCKPKACVHGIVVMGMCVGIIS